MKKLLSLTIFILILAGVTGCTTPAPEVVEDAPMTLQDRLTAQAADATAFGGLAAVGVVESKSLDVALNRAKAYARKDLTRLLNARIDALRDDFALETGLTLDPILSRFSDVAGAISSRYIRDMVAKELKYETAGGTVTACALMELDPQIILEEFSRDIELNFRLLSTRAFERFQNEITRYEEFKAGLIEPAE